MSDVRMQQRWHKSWWLSATCTRINRYLKKIAELIVVDNRKTHPEHGSSSVRPSPFQHSTAFDLLCQPAQQSGLCSS